MVANEWLGSEVRNNVQDAGLMLCKDPQFVVGVKLEKD